MKEQEKQLELSTPCAPQLPFVLCLWPEPRTGCHAGAKNNGLSLQIF